MTQDILDELRRIRPDTDELGRRWPAESRARVAAAIRRNDVTATPRLRHLPRSRRARLGAGAVLVAAAVAAGLAVPSLLPAGTPGAASPAAAAALNHLAQVAATTPVDTAGPDQFLHLLTRERQFGPKAPVSYVTTYETWTGSKGQVWQRQPGTRTLFFPAHDGDASYLASLPTDTGALEGYLRSHANGSDSTDEAVFVAIGDLLRGGNVPATLRSAAVGVLARTNHVTLGPARTDWHGRPVQEFDFVDDSQRPGDVESLFFDPHTAALLDERTTDPGSTRSSSVLVSDVVDSVPADIRHSAVRQK